MRIIIHGSGKKFLARDLSQDLHTQFGYFKKEDLKKAKSGSSIKANTGKTFSIFDASFLDLYRKIKRDAQIIPLKDIGLIVAETGIGKDSTVVDAGAGSGALACFLAHLVKDVTTYEIRKDFIEIATKNKKLLSLKNIRIKNKNIYEKIDEKNIDLVALDVPEPWKALESAGKALKPGGFLVSYSPTIPQAVDLVAEVEKHDGFLHIKTAEIIEREWDIQGRKVRPKSQAIGHSGFLTFVRKIR